ncbi:MAG: histidine kinase [Acidobacteriaceae bacterium]|nr:histidine kinase [Acidobacteriaceae bacterium]MBV8572938.1 histidine kinase [Acidobacteriaceae bacterium]
MHPLLRSKKNFVYYVLGSVMVGGALAFALVAPGKLSLLEGVSVAIPITDALAAVCLSAWFVARAVPLRTTPAWKKALNQMAAAVFASAIVLAFAHIWVSVLNHFFPGLERRFAPSLPVIAAMSWLIYLLALMISHLSLAMESSQRAEMSSREAELKALKAQINPHFLFNSLNSISALTSTDPAKAREMCIRLSDFLRSSLRLEEKTSISFEEELALTNSYLDVEKVRFGPRLRVLQDFDPGCAKCNIPPLLMQPLVENAIKHGVAMLASGGEIALSGHRNGQYLQVTVENPFDPDAPVLRKSGFGLVNVRNRLEARYGRSARLDIQVLEMRYRVVLSLPCEEPPNGRPA